MIRDDGIANGLKIECMKQRHPVKNRKDRVRDQYCTDKIKSIPVILLFAK